MRLGECTQSLDLSFFIPKEWNTLYVSDLLALLPMLPNLTSFRSRPCLPTLSQSGVPLPRPVPSSILLALAHSMRNNSLLNELELTQQESPALTDLATLLQNSVKLTTLTLGFYIFDSGSALSTAAVPSIRLPSLQSLRLHVTMNRPKGVLTAKPAAHLMVDASRWSMPELRNLELVLDHDIQALSSDSPFGTILHGFLNMHGHALRHLAVTETAPHLRSRPLNVSSLVPQCPTLECLTVGIVGCAPVRMVVPHHHLRRVQFVGTLGWITGGRRALDTQAAEVRAGMFPALREVVLVDERAVPPGWAEVMASVNVAVVCPRAAEEREADVWSDGEGSEDDDWAPPAAAAAGGEDDLSSEDDEDDGWFTDASVSASVSGHGHGQGQDGERSDDETVKNSSGRTTSYMGDDQIDHLGALDIFEKSLERVVGLPKNEGDDVDVDEPTAPPATVPTPARVSPPAAAFAPTSAFASTSTFAPASTRVYIPATAPASAPAPVPTRVSIPAAAPPPTPTQIPTPTSSQHLRPSNSPTHNRRLSTSGGTNETSHTGHVSFSGHQRRLSKDQVHTHTHTHAHAHAPPSPFSSLAGVGAGVGSSSAQVHHRRMSTTGNERPTLPPLSLSAQQSTSHGHGHGSQRNHPATPTAAGPTPVPITITAPTPVSATASGSRRAPTPTMFAAAFAASFGSSFRSGGVASGSGAGAAEARAAEADEETVGSARKRPLKNSLRLGGKKPR
jgi:hypothetical protein